MLSALVLLNTACSPRQDNNLSSSSAGVTASAAATAEAPAATSGVTTSAGEDSSAPATSALLDTYWKLTKLNDADVIVSDKDKQREPHIIFNAENRIAGSDGCNRMMGTYTLDGEKLTFSQIATTMMACLEGGEQADTFKKALEKVTTYTFHTDQLELRDSAGLTLVQFQAVAQP